MGKRKTRYGTRRNNNEGSVFQRADGLWCGMATIGYGENGKIKRKAIYGKTRIEVTQKLTEITKRISNSNYEIVQDSLLGTLMKEWLLVFKKNLVTPRTFEGNIRNFNLHILPKIGGMKLDEISNVIVQKLLNEMLAENYSLAVTRKVKFLLNQFFEYAIENRYVSTNPVIRTRVRSTEKKIYDSENKYKALPIQIREKFVDCLNGEPLLKPLCLCMMFAGLRAGETLALTWDNIDFENKTINVEKGITTLPTFDANGKVINRKTIVSTTKTACSVREVPIPNILIDALKYYKESEWIKGKENGIDLTAPSSLVFANDDGSVRSYSGTKCIFKRFLAKNNLNKYNIHFHSLRHTYSNTLFEANENPKVIQALLGHKSVSTTITTYNSVDKSYFKQAIDVFNNQYKKPQEEEATKVEKYSAEDLDEMIAKLEHRKQELCNDKNTAKKESDDEMEM